MATLKITLDNRHSHQDGRYPVIIRLTHNTKSTAIPANKRGFSSGNWG